MTRESANHTRGVSSMTETRVLVTASRDWKNRATIWPFLDVVYLWWHDNHRGVDAKLIVVHGDARGGDAMAKWWAIDRKRTDSRVDHEDHPANWKKFGKPAGFIRNKEMVDKGAHLCLGFPLSGPGTFGCMKLAVAAGIPTYSYEEITAQQLRILLDNLVITLEN